jgi:hypothetical protein
MNRIMQFLQSEIGKYTMIAASLVVASAVISWAAYLHASHLAAGWVKPLQPQYRALDETTAGFCKPPGQLPAASARLEGEVRELDGRMQHHLDVMVYFYSNYYRAIIMSSILGAVSGICLFYIANKGWATASNYVVTAFVISTVIGAFFFSLITIFRIQDNITANKVLYLQYVALTDGIATYCATGDSGEAGDATTKTLDSYLHEIDRQMAAINDVAIALDPSKIVDYKALLQQAKQSKPSGQMQ